MGIPYRAEMSLLDFEEQQIVRSTHYPYIADLERDALEDLRRRIRRYRDRETGFVRQKQRESSGKAEPRGGSFPGTISRPYQRKQVFSSALKRLNREIHRLRVFDAKTAQGEAARRALRLRRSLQYSQRPENVTSNEGARSLPSRRRHTIVSRTKIGSVSQQNKRFQAIKDLGS